MNLDELIMYSKDVSCVVINTIIMSNNWLGIEDWFDNA